MSNNITSNPQEVVEKIKNYPVFSFFCQKVIPLAFDESMSYLETIYAFQYFLNNTVLPTVNNNADAVTELQGLYEELNAYVTNYFDNLDVQEEINNKLDAMSQSGELTNLIKAYVDPFIEEQNEDIEDFEDTVRITINSFDSRLSAIASGSPAGVYSNLSTLRTQNPDHSKIYITADNGNWNYYNQSQQQFVSGGVYQASEDSETVNDLVKLLINKELVTNYELGSIGTNGVPTAATTRIRTSDYLPYRKCKISFNSGYKVGYYLYDSDKKMVDNSNGLKTTPLLCVNNEAVYMKFYLADVENSEITNILSFLGESGLSIKYNDDIDKSIDYTDQLKNVSLIQRGQIFNDTNLDNLYQVGSYYASLNSSLPENMPVSLPGIIINCSTYNTNNGQGLTQFYMDANGNKLCYRYKKASSWTAWKTVAITDDLTEINTQLDENIKYSYADISLFEKMGVIGDSWASGVVYPDGQHGENKYNISWPQVLGRKHGIDVTNFTKGGLRCDTWLTDAMGLTLLNSESAKNLYVVALGINDTTAIDNGTLTLGTTSDIDVNNSSNNANTFYGYYGKIISAIKTKAPNAKIILSTIPRSDKPTYATVNNAIIEIANLFNTPYIVALNDSLFTSDYFVTQTKVSSHPTAPSYSGMANAYSKLISKCIVENYQYFMNYYGE